MSEVPGVYQTTLHVSQQIKVKETAYNKKKKEQEDQETRQKILKGLIPYMVADSGATSSCGRPSNQFIKTGKPSTKKFHTPFGQVAQATKTEQQQHQMRALANTVDIIPGLQNNTLLNINKFAEANYVTVIMPEEVKIFYGGQTRLISTHQPII